MKTIGLRYILLGFALILFGATAPFLMTISVLQNSFWLCILAYSASVLGLFIGMFGAFQIHYDELDE